MSSEAVTTVVPSWENAALVTKPEWPDNVVSSRPLDASQSRAVMSHETVTIRLPSREKVALVTMFS
jgi:hypothetical protein